MGMEPHLQNDIFSFLLHFEREKKNFSHNKKNQHLLCYLFPRITDRYRSHVIRKFPWLRYPIDSTKYEFGEKWSEKKCHHDMKTKFKSQVIQRLLYTFLSSSLFFRFKFF